MESPSTSTESDAQTRSAVRSRGPVLYARRTYHGAPAPCVITTSSSWNAVSVEGLLLYSSAQHRSCRCDHAGPKPKIEKPHSFFASLHLCIFHFYVSLSLSMSLCVALCLSYVSVCVYLSVSVYVSLALSLCLKYTPTHTHTHTHTNHTLIYIFNISLNHGNYTQLSCILRSKFTIQEEK